MKVRNSLGIAAGIGFLYSGLVGATTFLQERTNRLFEKELKAMQPEIMRIQEEKIKIKHFGVPDVSYSRPYDAASGATIGQYFPNQNKIFLFPGCYDTGRFDLTVFFSLYNSNDPKSALAHETGHYFMDKLSESMGRGDWPNINRQTPENVGIKLVSEGTAEYFENVVSNDPDTFQDSEWPKNPDAFWNVYVVYKGGYHLVKPVVDRCGKEGLVYLMTNPPTVEDLKDLPSYQKRAIQTCNPMTPLIFPNIDETNPFLLTWN